MRTTNLTWPQARNLLYCNLCTSVTYQDYYLNIYYLVHGKLTTSYREGDIKHTFGPKYPDYDFKVLKL